MGAPQVQEQAVDTGLRFTAAANAAALSLPCVLPSAVALADPWEHWAPGAGASIGHSKVVGAIEQPVAAPTRHSPIVGCPCTASR